MWYRSELKEHAKAVLKRNYWKAVLVALILSIISGGGSGSGGSSSYNSSSSSESFQSIIDDFQNFDSSVIVGIASVLIVILVVFLVIFAISLVLGILVFNPLVVGAQRFFILCRKEGTSLNELTYAFSHSYKNVIKTMFLRSLYTFLWSLLLIIPGIIKSYEYRMIPYILAENPDMDTKDVFARTKLMMDGEKWRTFCLDLSFIGWQILGVLTCCILSLFYVNPYYYLTCTELYLVLKQKVDGSANTYAGFIDSNNIYSPNYENQENPYM